MNFKTFSALAVLTLCATALTACGDDEAKAEPVEKDQASWALPLDQFRPPDQQFLAYASDLIKKDCMDKKGQPYTVVAYDQNAPLQETRNSVGRKLFNVDIAQKYGYHDAPQKRYSRKDLQNRYTSNDAAWQNAVSECDKKVKASGIDFTTIEDYAGELGLSVDYYSGQDVEAALSRWRECLAPLGLPDPPTTPDDMPGTTLGQQFGLDKQTAWDAPPAGQEEIRIAVADAKCRESSGVSKAAYEQEFADEQELVEKNKSDLMPLIEKHKKLTETAQEIINEHAK